MLQEHRDAACRANSPAPAGGRSDHARGDPPRLVSITNQIDANIKRTAFSPYIYEYNDFAVGLAGADGQLVAQCTGGMPPFVADSVGMAVRDGLKIYGRERLHHGDVVVCNHAAVQGQHLNNTVMYTPIYARPPARRDADRVLRHQRALDRYRRHPVPVSTDIFMEGLQLRSIKLWSKGEPIEEVYRIIENNTRLPLELMGDIAAQLAGCLLGRDLTAELADKYGVATFGARSTLILDQSEAAARAFIRAMPDGVYAAETFLDNDRSGDEPVPIKVKVIVAGDEMTVDYSEHRRPGQGADQFRLFRRRPDHRARRVQISHGRGRDGERRHVPPAQADPAARQDLSAEPTAPMGKYPTPFPTVIDAIIKALEQALPERVPGGHFGTHSGVRFYGRASNGTFFDSHDSGHGGWGACATHDGAGPFRTMAHGDTRIIPLELQEAVLPFRIEEFALREDSAGAGKFRGGLGFRKSYRILAPCNLGTNLDRTACPPWGVQGGRRSEARPLHASIKAGSTGEPREHRQGKGLSRSNAGDIVCVETGGGGGYGPPAGAALPLIQRDLDAGYVSARRPSATTA